MEAIENAPSVRFLDLERRRRGERRNETSIVARNAAFWLAGAAVVPGAALLLRRSPRAAVLAGFGIAACGAFFRYQFQRWFTEEPAYAVEGRLGEVEIRRYDPVVVARTEVAAPTWREALEDGFDRLAWYIFGGNRTGERIAMTAPVTHSRESVRRTSLVTSAEDGAGRWVMTFTMPRGRALTSLPWPHDARVTLRARPARRVAVLRYSGAFSGDLAERKQRELVEMVEAAGLVPRGMPLFAGYDPPGVLPFFRRNEAWVETETLEEQLE
ncbi:MAG TPA: heme-binding protein [Polyangiaceae bacterium]|jgi:hypothetical protein|nr:heme-binding protein [Polyangiaceae bacterium]